MCNENQSIAKSASRLSYPSDPRGASSWTCTDPCCSTVTRDNTWRQLPSPSSFSPLYSSFIPNQLNAHVVVTFDMQDLRRVFFVNDEPSATSIQQVLLPLPTDWTWNGNSSTCGIQSHDASGRVTLGPMLSTHCNITLMAGQPYVLVDANTPSALNASVFSVHLVNLTSPRGMLVPHEPPKPLHFIAKLPNVEFRVFSSVLLVESIQPGVLSEGIFAPENVLPQAVGNATLRFTTSVALPRGTILRVNFSQSGFNFIDSQWWVGHQPDNSPSASFTPSVVPASSYDDKTKVWLLPLPLLVAARSSVQLQVARARNPEAAFKDSFAAIPMDAIAPPSTFVVAQGTVTATLVRDVTASPPSSPYNWISLVLLMLSLTFCLVMLYKHGLFWHPWHPIALFSDLTAVASVAGLVLGVVNNALWISGANNFTFFYVKTGVSSVAFTMLLSVCVHWGAVLSHRVRKLPIAALVGTFVLLNGLFYTFQLVVGLHHHDVVAQVYGAEQSVNMLAPTYPCKNGPTFQFVFSDIQPYYTQCYLGHLGLPDVHFFTWFSNATYSMFALLTLGILGLGYMVMQKGSKILHLISYSRQQIYLMKALRLYTALVALVTATYLIAFSMQFVQVELPYYWWYLTTVWLPQCIPPCSFIFLQWNSATKSLRKENNSERSDTAEDAMVATPRITTYDPSTTLTLSSKSNAHDRHSLLHPDPFAVSSLTTNDTSSTTDEDDSAVVVGLSLRLVLPEPLPHGCYVAIESQSPLDSKWIRVGTTETLTASPPTTTTSSSSSSSSSRYVVMFLSVVPVPASSSTVRFLAFAARDPLQRSSDSDDVSLNNDDMSVQYQGIVDGLEYLDDDASDSDYEQGGGDDNDPLLRLLQPPDRCVASFCVEGCFDYYGHSTTLRATHSRFQSSAACHLVVTVVPCRRRPSSNDQDMTTMVATYHLQDVLVVETLTESEYSNSIPGQYLDIVLARRTKAYFQASRELDQFLAMEHARLHQGVTAAAGMGSLYENLLEQIQGEADRRQCRDWYGRLMMCSLLKKHVELACIPLNLHLQTMHVAPQPSNLPPSNLYPHRISQLHDVCLYDTTTVGAFAAHVYEFKQGGVFSLRQEASKCSISGGSQSSSLFPTTWQYLSQVERRRCDLEWTVNTRLDVCVPQALAALATALTATLRRLVHQPLQFERLIQLGFVFHVESLLSTYGAELGMLEDMMEAMQTVGTFRILLVPHADNASDTQGQVVESVDLYTNVDDAVAGHRRHDHAKSDDTVNQRTYILFIIHTCRGKVLIPKRCLVSIHPLLFNVGINDKQSLANMSMAAYPKKLQDHINDSALQRLKSVVAAFCDLVPADTSARVLLQELTDAVHVSNSGRRKHPQVLQASSRLVRHLDGGRVTVCTSGKDRTAMAVTLEQGMLLSWHHNLALENVPDVVATMRSRGVRIENCRKNTGRRKFASFNPLQRSMVPEPYRCPPETGGRHLS
ncbi:hypothetical protein DYB36_007112 [Aphanomyces astaci]|uniref:Uncharacterized protein n=1 Tax=Aphanomyces astaci TaxID=112090 RepID=A0A397APK0_APHAT|nr:hypothetical protein DYB36_007112 [Aphanomyces astaci]